MMRYGSKKESVNVIMPVYNEQRTLREIIERVLAQKMVDRLIIVDDNSSDKSPEIIRSMAKKDGRVEFLKNASNGGKGYSVRRGMELVEKGIVIIQDADLEYYPEDYGKLLKNLKDDTFVLGTRIITTQKGQNYLLVARAFVNDILTLEFNILFGRNVKDINTCYKVFKKEMLGDARLKENGFLIDPEILVTLIKRGYKTAEVGARYSGRTYAEGKKITASDGIKQAFFLIKSRF
jgi:glycosyltransferase involved in cell wall biosynthesis